MLTRLITSEIALAAEIEGHKVLVIYIFCESYSAPSPLLWYINQELVNSIPDLKNKMVGTSISRNLEYFCELVNLIPMPIILIFDEIDKLSNPDIINQLSRIKECGFTQSNICIIGITNDTIFYDNLDGRTKSIIGQNELFIPPYNAEELADILQARANLAFEDKVYEEVVIPLCAAFGAQENGDARKAMDLLRLSGENAELRESLKICEQDVRIAKGKVEINRQVEIIQKLPTQTKAVLFACTHRHGITGSDLETTEIYSSYLNIAEVISLDTVTLRRVGDYISELASIGILSINKISRGRRRGVVNFVKPITDTYIIKQVILQDIRFEELQRRL
jgi:cell division control protein 6